MKADRAPSREPLLRLRVDGQPAASATAGELPWKEMVAATVDGIAFDPAGTVLALEFVVAARPGYPQGPDIDDLCDPVIATLVGRLGWFGGKRPAIQGLWARKRVGPRTGCEISVFAGWQQVALGNVPVLLDATWTDELPRSGRDLVFAQWVGRELRGLPSPGSRIAVRLAFSGRMNVAEIATGRVKNVVDCLWPILGGTPGAPADDRVSILAATQRDATAGGTVRVTVISQGQTRPTAMA